MIQNEIKQAHAILMQGGVILYPTDTIWGIGCDATCAEAVEKIYQIKERDPQKSMLVLVSDLAMAERYIDELPEAAIQLFEVSDQPLTLILDGARNLAPNLPASDGSIGIRIPDDDFCLGLLHKLRRPLVSTSANLSGDPSPGCFADIPGELLARADYVVNWRQEEPPQRQASSIIRIRRDGQITIIRK